MSRKNLLISAILLNAALLICLFTVHLSSNNNASSNSAVELLASHNKPTESSTLAPLVQQGGAPDHLDEVIKKYLAPEVEKSSLGSNVHKSEIEIQGNLFPKVEEKIPSFKEIKVQKGDVLERLARQHKVSVREIMQLNQLTSTRLRIGQSLKMPYSQAADTDKREEEQGRYYLVQSGDNPSIIAKKHQIKVEQFLQLNKMTEESARQLKPGEKVRVQ